MENNQTIEKLVTIKAELSQIGYEYLETKKPVELRDLGVVLKPFIELSDSFDKTIKKLKSDIITESIPKSNTIK